MFGKDKNKKNGLNINEKSLEMFVCYTIIVFRHLQHFYSYLFTIRILLFNPYNNLVITESKHSDSAPQ
jgi:hypothetical protein